MVGCAVHRQSKCLNDSGADQIGRTERVGTRKAAPVTGILKQVRKLVPGIGYYCAGQKNTPEEGVLGTLLIIDFADVVSIVLRRPGAIRDLATRIVCRREGLRASIIDHE